MSKSLTEADRLAALEATLKEARASLAAANRAHQKAHAAWKEAHMAAHPDQWTSVRLASQRDDKRAISNPAFGL